METYGSVQNMLTLLLTDFDFGLPTVEQYKSTFRVDIAKYLFDCYRI